MTVDELSLHLKRDVDIISYEMEASRPSESSGRLVQFMIGSLGKLRMRSLWKEHDEHC